jgi:hypothetical protein
VREKRLLLSVFVLKTIVLPRQARDKHRESSNKEGVFRRAAMAKALPPDLLLFSSVLGAELNREAGAAATEGAEEEEEEEGGVVQRLVSAVDVLWTDVAGLLALFEEQEGVAPPAAGDLEAVHVTVCGLLQRLDVHEQFVLGAALQSPSLSFF